ncbi:hypothetical protein HMPREF0577_0551 [Mobiluncus mulieris ATCC 35243]|nr:hypothetical protein HMPREF0577_0551 [Mobiluncus mulieris ATCC 35243]
MRSLGGFARVHEALPLGCGRWGDSRGFMRCYPWVAPVAWRGHTDESRYN